RCVGLDTLSRGVWRRAQECEEPYGYIAGHSYRLHSKLYAGPVSVSSTLPLLLTCYSKKSPLANEFFRTPPLKKNGPSSVGTSPSLSPRPRKAHPTNQSPRPFASVWTASSPWSPTTASSSPA